MKTIDEKTELSPNQPDVVSSTEDVLANNNNALQSESTTADNEAEEIVDDLTGGDQPTTDTSNELVSKYFSDVEIVNGMATIALDVLQHVAKWKEAESKFIEMIKDVPELGMLFKLLSDGATWEEAAGYVFDEEQFEPMKDDPIREKWSEGRNKRKSEREQLEASSKEFQTAQDQSAQALIDFAKTKNMKDEEARTFFNFIKEVIQRITGGTLTPEFIEQMFQAYNIEDELANATEEGRLEVKNAKIDDMKAKADSKAGDQLPDLGAGGASEVNDNKQKKSRINIREPFRV